MSYLRIMTCLLLLLLTACEKLSLLFTPRKEAIPSHTPQSIEAENYFWQTLHQGQYENIDDANKKLMIAYLANPNDPKLAAHLGFLHIWKITERKTQKNPLLPNQIILSKQYFEDALEMEPNNPIYKGFLGDTQLVSGQIFKNQREKVRGYFTLKHAITMWPQFNYFTAGYPMSTLPADSKYFKEALTWQWLTLDRCAGVKIDRTNPNYEALMPRISKTGKQRACWNSWIAPYNFEGFFLNMGDMLVKSGDLQTAIKIYQTAKAADNYKSWPFRALLEKRIENVKQNMVEFNKKNNAPEKSVIFSSGHGCMICHQQSTES